MKYSLAKIGNELGVSKSTVSLVLSGKAREARISAELEQTIKDFCKQVNYVPNIHAQRINRKFARNIGFLVNRGIKVDDSNPFSDYNINDIFSGIVLEAEKEKYKVSIRLCDSEIDEDRVFEWLRSSEIDGLIYYGLLIPKHWREVFAKENRFVVGIGVEPDNNICSVNTDNFTSSAQLTRRLIDDGRKSFIYFQGIENSFVGDERKRGFLSACMENGIEKENITVVNASYSEHIAQKMMLQNRYMADAIVCANDDMAIGVLKALKEMNVKVPEQVAVAGGDDVIISRYISPTLTTFSNNQYELGKNAVKAIIKMIQGKNSENIIIPGRLKIREST